MGHFGYVNDTTFRENEQPNLFGRCFDETENTERENRGKKLRKGKLVYCTFEILSLRLIASLATAQKNHLNCLIVTISL